MNKQHAYQVNINWTGNKGQGTAGYRLYDRSHTLSINYKVPVLCSSDPAFLGDATLHNPEELLLASISSCHMLWFLHLCADAGIIVTAYFDNATGVMEESKEGGGRFTSVTLYPQVTVTESSMIEKANSLHQKANELCFIANSCNFPIHHQPLCRAGN